MCSLCHWIPWFCYVTGKILYCNNHSTSITVIATIAVCNLKIQAQTPWDQHLRSGRITMMQTNSSYQKSKLSPLQHHHWTKLKPMYTNCLQYILKLNTGMLERIPKVPFWSILLIPFSLMGLPHRLIYLPDTLRGSDLRRETIQTLLQWVVVDTRSSLGNSK